jgi:flagellar basal-body rod modification protein FlgD
MASAVNSLFGASSTNAAAGSGSTTSGSNAASASTAPSEEVFLQLLVSQIQNQDPLNPADSTQFVTQLAQFSELEQVIGIRSDIESQTSASQAAAAAAATNTTSNSDATGSSTSKPSGTTSTSNN